MLDIVSTSCPRLSRASTSCKPRCVEDVDGRDKPGHDEWKVLRAGRSALRCGLALVSKPMRQDLPQHAPLDCLVGCCRLVPPEAVVLHGFGSRHKAIRDRREICVRVIEAEDQAPGADPAEREAF